MIDHVTIFTGKWANRRKLRSYAQFHIFTIYLKGFSFHVSRKILFSTKKESISKLIAKKMKKKDTPTSTPTPTPRGRFTETQSPTHNVGCLLMATWSFSSLLNCTSPCGSSSRSPQEVNCKSCRFLELSPHGVVQFNKDEKLQDTLLISMLMLDLYKFWKMQHWVLKLVRFLCFLH